jgi:hypothetical protein
MGVVQDHYVARTDTALAYVKPGIGPKMGLDSSGQVENQDYSAGTILTTGEAPARVFPAGWFEAGGTLVGVEETIWRTRIGTDWHGLILAEDQRYSPNQSTVIFAVPAAVPCAHRG